jgi:hypothetical protein
MFPTDYHERLELYLQSDTRNILNEIHDTLIQSEYTIERIEIPWKLIFTLRQHAWIQSAMIEDILTGNVLLFGVPVKIIWNEGNSIVVVQSKTKKD